MDMFSPYENKLVISSVNQVIGQLISDGKEPFSYVYMVVSFQGAYITKPMRFEDFSILVGRIYPAAVKSAEDMRLCGLVPMFYTKGDDELDDSDVQVYGMSYKDLNNLSLVQLS
jgi:hypothetical protein